MVALNTTLTFAGEALPVSRKENTLTLELRNGRTVRLNYAFRPPPSFEDTLTLDMNLLAAAVPQAWTDNVTFTRSTTKTRFNSSGYLESVAIDVPACDYQAGTTTPRGVSLEPQRTNLILRSENFSSAAWTNQKVTVGSNLVTGPDNTASGDTLTTISGGGVDISFASQAFAVDVSSSYTNSWTVKAGTESIFGIRTLNFTNPGNVNSYFDLATGTVSSSGAGHTTRTTAQGSGWHRTSITFTSDAADTTGNIYGHLCNASGSLNVDQDGASTMHFYSAQFEKGAWRSSYIPTTTSAVTRTADNASITGADFTALGIADGGTIMVEFEPHALGLEMLALSNGTSSHKIALNAAAGAQMVVTAAGAAEASIGTASMAANTTIRVAIRFGNNDFAISVNGAAVQTDPSGTMPTIDRLIFGTGQHLRRTKVFSAIADDAKMMELSTP